MSKSENKQSSKWFEIGYEHLLGGFVSISTSSFSNMMIGKIPTATDLPRIFLHGGINNLVSNEINTQFETYFEEYNNPNDSWIIKLTSGIAIGATTSLLSTILDNIYQYHESRTENNDMVAKNSMDFLKQRGVSSILDGYKNNLLHGIIYQPFENLFFSLNGKWLSKYFQNSKNKQLAEKLFVPFLNGSISTVQTILLTKPIEHTLHDLRKKNNQQTPRLVHETLQDLKSKPFNAGIGSVFFTACSQAFYQHKEILTRLFLKSLN
ncbi:hypothetical protein M0813_14435 [Anaeramoeba flamelloides]|uniref:Mitochondrial carrier protein n=1 Tax=Anaeramoeba flamelloides TaxID=1746091 RepID=A0ABQ8Z6I0_9EUKA|nr:hypothetical protein M0813_14435 [Anaeramoeba flamelloides]